MIIINILFQYDNNNRLDSLSIYLIEKCIMNSLLWYDEMISIINNRQLLCHNYNLLWFSANLELSILYALYISWSLHWVFSIEHGVWIIRLNIEAYLIIGKHGKFPNVYSYPACIALYMLNCDMAYMYCVNNCEFWVNKYLVCTILIEILPRCVNDWI